MTGFANNLFAGERFSVVGLGRNGLPAVVALHAMGATVTAWDDKAEAREAAAAAGIALADPCAGDLAVDAMVLSPGIPHVLPKPHPAASRAIASGVPILTDVELLYRAVRKSGSRARFAGITGTNGKSTTTSLPPISSPLLACPWPRAPISAPPPCPCRCCRTTASMFLRCRLICWSESRRFALMLR